MKNDLFKKIDEVIWWHLRRTLPAFGLLIFAVLFTGLTVNLNIYCGDEISGTKFLTLTFVGLPYIYGYSKNYYRHKNGDDFYDIWRN